ncbi:MAG: protease inhibitor I42 family protein [Anaerolineae bacterium]|nr:protease inhibitor I42 family protein [Anaerolineae bacterium]
MRSKLYVVGLALILSALILGGCGSATVEPVALPTTGPRPVSHSVELREGETYTIALETDPSSGNEREVEYSEVLLELVDRTTDNAAGEEVFIFRARAVGVTEAYFSYSGHHEVICHFTIGADPALADAMSEAEAREIAASSECGEAGALLENALYNDWTATWWIDLDIQKEGCNPACVVNVRTRQAEINWRCMGVLPPEDTVNTPAPAPPPTEITVVGWCGLIVSLPDGSDYLALQPEGSGEIGLTGADADVEAEIVALRDSGFYANFWGTLTCDVPNYGGCQLVATRLDPSTPPGPRFDPDPVEGWQGQLFSVPGMAQFDDYFVLDGPFPVRYGFQGADEALQAQLEDLRDTSATVRIWGEIQCAIPDVCGCQIGVERWELVAEESPPLGVHFESPVVGWYGQVVGLSADAQYDDFLRLLPLGAGDVGLTGADAALEAEIEGLRDSDTNAHFWGAIVCGAPDYDGCQVTVTRVIPEGAGPYPDPNPVEGWEGRYFFGRGLGGFDDCFILDFYGPFGIRYGIRGADEALEAALEDLRSMDKLTDPPPDIQIWGEVQCGVSDVNGCQIIVDRLEELFSQP